MLYPTISVRSPCLRRHRRRPGRCLVLLLLLSRFLAVKMFSQLLRFTVRIKILDRQARSPEQESTSDSRVRTGCGTDCFGGTNWSGQISCSSQALCQLRTLERVGVGRHGRLRDSLLETAIGAVFSAAGAAARVRKDLSETGGSPCFNSSPLLAW